MIDHTFPLLEDIPTNPELSLLRSLEPLAEAPTTPLAPAIPRFYAVYLYTLLLDDEYEEARFLCKRARRGVFEIDSAEDVAPEYAVAWAAAVSARKVLLALWNRDFPLFFTTASTELERLFTAAATPPHESALLQSLISHVREQNYAFVARAFSSISLAEVAQYFGLSDDETKEQLIVRGWSASVDGVLSRAPAKSGGVATIEGVHKDRLEALVALVTHMQS
ncbi:uncharacterized protein V1518DRAFT_118189 [Limtongia smithiae]|uniref:uncharacterized protein n=1 Tax=Limtongia smithiae TaxID=1125753 RepID=UPI0034D01E18